MSDHRPSHWLAELLDRARIARWCTRTLCTTCGCLEFRRAFWAAAAGQAGIEVGVDDVAHHPYDSLAAVSTGDRVAILGIIVAAMRALPPRWTQSEAFRTIIIDLDRLLMRHGVPMALEPELSGTPAGEALARMRAHSEEVRARRVQQEAYNAPAAAEDRRRAERQIKAVAHAMRQSETRRKNAERIELLAILARLAPVERLVRFATDPALVLDCVSVELIPAHERDLIDLDNQTAVALVEKIGRRRGPWGRLRRMLERFAEPRSPT